MRVHVGTVRLDLIVASVRFLGPGSGATAEKLVRVIGYGRRYVIPYVGRVIALKMHTRTWSKSYVDKGIQKSIHVVE